MKVISRGNLDKGWEYKCPICGCVFVASVLDRANSLDHFRCPECGYPVEVSSGKEIERFYDDIPGQVV